MPLVGLNHRARACKICTNFPDEVLDRITLDLITHSRSWEEIKTVYSPLLPPGVKPLNDVNLGSHKRHVDPELVTKQHLQQYGYLQTEEAEKIFDLYQERFKEVVDEQALLELLYRQRLENLFTLQKLLNEYRYTWEQAKLRGDTLAELQLRKAMVKLTEETDAILADLQKIIVVHTKGTVEATPVVVTNILQVVTTNSKAFLEELSGVLMYELFPNDRVLGETVVRKTGELMDKWLRPVLTISREEKALVSYKV